VVIYSCDYQQLWLSTRVAFDSCGYQQLWLSTVVVINNGGYQQLLFGQLQLLPGVTVSSIC